MKEPLFNRIDQIGLVVYNVDKYVKYYEKFFGKDVFQIFEGESIRIFEDGREEKIRGKAAFAKLGNIQIELLEITEGPAIHVEWLRERGEGIHHLGMFVSDFEKSLKTFQDAKIPILHLGRARSRFAYMDTKPFALEIIETLPGQM